MRLLLLAALALSAASCFHLELDADAYDRGCSADADCVPVFEGDPCAVCACANAAIRSTAHDSYAADADRLRDWCGPMPAIACGPCPEPVVACVSGRCELTDAP